MTNEEKAREIRKKAQESKLVKSLFILGFQMGNRYVEEIEMSALEMAEWKDAQFKEYIEAHKQPVLASETDDTIVGYSINADMLIEWLKSNKG